MNINDWKISTKLMAAFGAVVATIAALGAVVFLQITELNRTGEAIVNGQAVLDTVNRIERAIDIQESNTRAYLVFQNEKYLDRIRDARESYNAQIESLEDQIRIYPGALDRVAKVEEAVARYASDIVDKETGLAGDPATYEQAVEIVRSGLAGTLMDSVDEALEAVRAKNQERLDAAMDDDAVAESTAMTAIVVGVLIAATLAMLFGWWLSQNTSKLISVMSGAMRRLANGDNTLDIPCVGRKDEMGDMADAVLTFKNNAVEKVAMEAAKAKETAEDNAAIGALAEGLAALAAGNLLHRIETPFAQKTQQLKDDFNAAIGQLDEVMSVIAGNASGIRSAAGEVSHAADDLSRRTEQQAANLEETAAALDQITATVRKTALSATSANTVVTNTRSEAEQSGRVVTSAVEAMTQIEGSSRQINQIIGVIDEIAFQTNLLALNAGVEAARAGEAGRGFAVVASEVRALAQRSADAAKEIKALITASSGQVESGVSLVGQTGDALRRIMAQVSEISVLVSEIAASAQEQSTGLNQVNTAVNQMDQVTQQNAAMVEESTAASRSLAQESVELSNLVGRFKVTNAVVIPMAVRSEAIAKRKKRGGAVPQMKSTSQARAQPAADEASWEEF